MFLFLFSGVSLGVLSSLAIILLRKNIRESPPKFENQIKARVFIRNITRSTMYRKAPFCYPELTYGK